MSIQLRSIHSNLFSVFFFIFIHLFIYFLTFIVHLAFISGHINKVIVLQDNREIKRSRTKKVDNRKMLISIENGFIFSFSLSLWHMQFSSHIKTKSKSLYFWFGQGTFYNQSDFALICIKSDQSGEKQRKQNPYAY